MKSAISHQPLAISSRQRGFTLIEALVGIAVLLTAVAGPLTIAARGVSSGTVSRDQVIAYNLAHEALEAAHNQRDRNALEDPTNPEWLRGMVDPGGSDTCEDLIEGCYVEDIQKTNIKFTNCNTPCVRVRQHTSGLYGHETGSGWTDTKFTRIMRITTPVGTNNDEAQAVVTVSWPQGNTTRNIVLRETLFRWRQ